MQTDFSRLYLQILPANVSFLYIILYFYFCFPLNNGVVPRRYMSLWINSQDLIYRSYKFCFDNFGVFCPRNKQKKIAVWLSYKSTLTRVAYQWSSNVIVVIIWKNNTLLLSSSNFIKKHCVTIILLYLIFWLKKLNIFEYI